MSVVDIEEAFGNFLEEQGAEVSDRILAGPNKPKNPDYVFRDDKIIAELKLLKTDPFLNRDFIKSFEEKKRNWVKKGYITQEEMSKVTTISQLPAFCYDDIVKLYMRPIKNHIDSANKQIKAMKERLKLEDYKGLLFIGSDGNYFIQPRHARHFIAELLKSGLFSSINTVVYLTVNMITTIPGDPTFSRLWINLYRDKDKFESVPVVFLKDLYQKWFDYYKNLAGIELDDLGEMNDEGLTEKDLLKDAEFVKPS